MHTKKSGAWRGMPAGARLAALIVLLGLWPCMAWPQGTDQKQFDEEVAKQQSIYRSRGADVPGGYITSRSLKEYTELLPAGFGDALRKLGPADSWLDIGAGGGQAVLDYYASEFGAAHDGARTGPGAKARAVAISIEDRRTEQWRKRAASLGEDRIRYLFGKRLREYSREELGKFQIITDVYGGFSYTTDLSLFLEKVLDLLEVGGSFYTMVQSVHLEDGKDNPRTWYLTELVDPAGHDVKVCSWLKSVACVKVTCDSRSTWEAPTELILIRKACNEVSVPPLKALQYEAGNPPGRRFQLHP